MATIQELRTFKNIQDAIISRAKLDGNKTEVRNRVKEHINTYYQHLGFKRAYNWSGDSRTLTLKEKYDTGTITVTNANTTITGASTAWTEFDHLFCKIKIGSDSNPYKIIRVASTTSAVIDHPYTGDTEAGVSYSMYRDELGLYPDLQNIRTLRIPGSMRPLNPIGPDEMDQYRFVSPFRSGNPQYYTINGLNVYTSKTWADFLLSTDFWEDDYFDKPKNKNLIIWPGIVASDTIAHIRYTKILPPLNSDDEEPLVPYENRRVLVIGPLVEHYMYARDSQMKHEWEKEYKQLLKEMEADVETIDSELIFQVDRRRHRREGYFSYSDEELVSD